jgi:hypothetical protein
MFIGAIAGIVVALGVFGAVAWQRFDRLSAKFGASQFSVTPSADSDSVPSTEKTSADSRPVYRYSVIPGGVRTPEELLEAMANDSVVAGHYAGIDKANLTVGRVSQPLQAHVSYRIGDRVYWTKRTVTIQAGEQVVTDGKTLVRGRCGNNISVAPLLPTLDNEPKPDVFDSIVAPLAPNTLVKLDPAHSYFTPQDLKTPQGPGGRAPFGNSVGGFAGPPPAGNGGTPGTFSNPPSGDPTPNGVPPGGNPPGEPPGNPCGSVAATTSSEGARPADGCGGNPPGGDPKGDPKGNPPGDPPSDPPTDLTPHDVPNTLTAVPEPGTLFLVAGGAAALLAHRIRRNKRG